MTGGRAQALSVRSTEPVRAHDQGFVASDPGTVYGVLAEVGAYPAWWPGVNVTSEGPDLLLRLSGWPAVPVRPEAHRPGVGLFLRLGEPLDGTLEWYLEPFQEGTIVNAILSVSLRGGSGRASRRLRRLRRAIRAGLVALRGRVG